MCESLKVAFTHGTHRLISPEETLARIEPHLPAMGITRLADITGLDVDLGVPVYTAVRPAGLVLQTGNGKGLTPAASKASALMEAIELYHAENPELETLALASAREMRRRGETVFIPPRDDQDRAFFFSDDFQIYWVRADDLVNRTKVWVPASKAWFMEPTSYRETTNGLASGNHLVEATLHGLYELIERDAVSGLEQNGRLCIRESCEVVDLGTIDNPILGGIIRKAEQSGLKPVLLHISAVAGVEVFWALLLDHAPFGPSTAMIAGYGAHPGKDIAASRAITEAIQSRLTMIQAARDDIIKKECFQRIESEPGIAFQYFEQLEPTIHWHQIKSGDEADDHDLGKYLDHLIEALSREGHHQIFRVNLQKRGIGIPVVKMIVPSLRLQRGMI